MRRLCASLMLWLTIVPVTGCYSTVPLEAFPPQPGADVDVALTTEGTQAMSSVLGPRVTRIQGRFIDVQSDSVYVAVTAVSLTNGDSNFWQHERVGVPRPYVATVGLRKLSPTKSGVIAAGLVAGLAAITGLVASQTGGRKTGGPPKGQ